MPNATSEYMKDQMLEKDEHIIDHRSYNYTQLAQL